MIKLHLSRLMGERRLKIADVVRDTGVSRTALTRLYYEKVERLDLETLELLCRYLDVDISDMLEMTDNDDKSKLGS
jgi:putative transcriptional regulator